MSAVPAAIPASQSALQHILYDKIDPAIVRITLNRTDKHNAQDTRFLYELNAAYDRAAQDADVKVIILAANGKHFSAGHDLSGVREKATVYAQFPHVGTTARELQSDPGRGFAGNALVERINALIEQRCALTIRRLTDPAAEKEADANPSA